MGKKATITIYPKSVAKIKLHNRSILLGKLKDGNYGLQFKKYDKDNSNEPACLHENLKGRIKVTSIKLSEEAVQHIVAAYIGIQERNRKDKLKTKTK